MISLINQHELFNIYILLGICVVSYLEYSVNITIALLDEAVRNKSLCFLTPVFWKWFVSVLYRLNNITQFQQSRLWCQSKRLLDNRVG